MPSSATSQQLLGPLNPVERKFAPATLWTAGDATLLRRHPRVAVIGTRQPTEDGVRRAGKLVNALVQHGAIVVSGLAAGIDTVAHKRAMDIGGRTIAVIGTPLDDVFPKENEALQQRIAETNLVVSQFEPGVVVGRGNFPRRNRTMALIADASVIIEAGEGSGTVSQGWEALRLGRPLFLLKSLVASRLPWTVEMLNYGARVLTGAEEVLDVLPTDAIRDAVAF